MAVVDISQVKADDIQAAPAPAPAPASAKETDYWSQFPVSKAKPRLDRDVKQTQQANPDRTQDIWRNPRTGRTSKQLGPGESKTPLDVLDTPVTGGQEAIEGAKQVAQPGWRNKAGGAHKIIAGAFEASTPLAVASGVEAPLKTAATVAGGMITQQGVEEGLRWLGLPKEYAQVAGDIAGILAGAKAHKSFDAKVDLRSQVEPVLKERLEANDNAIRHLLKVEPPGPKRDALIEKAKARGIEIPKITTRREEAEETLAETARVDSQFDEAERRLAEKEKSKQPPSPRKTGPKAAVPGHGVPEEVARAQDARERIIGKPREQWTNADVLAADQLISEGYTGGSGSTVPRRPPPTVATKPKGPTQSEIDAERMKIIGKPRWQWKESDIQAADELRSEGHVGSTRPEPPAPPKNADAALKKTKPKPAPDKRQERISLVSEPPKASTVTPSPVAKPAESPAPVAASAKTETAEAPPSVFQAGFASGKSGTAKVARGYKVPFKYAVVDADNLITSHDPHTLEENPGYDQSIQPRDRTRAGYAEQINAMTATLDPEELGHSYKASDGSPIVGDDGLVESGNGRTISLKRVYESHPEKATEYKEWIKDNASQFGIDPESLNGIGKPVLVRLRTGLPEGVSRPEFARDANEDSKATMGAVETASSDSKALTPDVMALFEPSESGEINTAGNRAFVQKFANSVVAPGQKNPFMLADGSISAEGLRRVKNALFAKAYGGSTALDKLAEDPSDNTKAITNGLVIAAPKFADMQSAIERGDLYDLNPAGAISRAVSRLTALRENRQTIKDFLNQEDMFGKDPMEGLVLDIFDRHMRSAQRIASVFKKYADYVEEVGSPKQAGMFQQEPPTPIEILKAADDKITAEEAERAKARDTKAKDAAPLFNSQAAHNGEAK